MPTPVQCTCASCCDIGSDPFTRTDNDSLGADWSERSGDADIVSNQLKFMSTGIVRYETAHPDGASGKQYVTVDAVIAATTDYARVLMSVSDDSNYIYASVEQVSSCWVLRLRDVTAGSDTSLQDDVPLGDADISGTTISFKVCYDPSTETFSAVVDDIHASRKVGVTAPNGSKVGLAGSTNTIFDNFYFKRLEDTTYTICPSCNTGCYIGADPFTRSNSTNIGCLWTEVSGNWDINTNQLRQIGTGAGIVKYLKFHPTLDLNHYVEVDVVLPAQVPSAVANEHRVLVNYADASNYHYAQFTLASSGVSATLTVGKNGGASDSTGGTWLAGTYRMVVCWDDDSETLTASVQRAGATLGKSLSSSRVASGMFVGLAASSSSTGNEKFDNFEFWKHESDEEPDCPDCPEFTTSLPCTDCCTSPSASDSYTIDLGPGGLTSDACCTGCETLSGDYFLQAENVAGECRWHYRASIAGPCGIAMYLRLEETDGTHCRWRFDLTGSIGGALVGTEPCASTNSIGYLYYSAPFLKTQCLTTATLTLDSSVADAICDGSLPNTITVEAA